MQPVFGGSAIAKPLGWTCCLEIQEREREKGKRGGREEGEISLFQTCDGGGGGGGGPVGDGGRANVRRGSTSIGSLQAAGKTAGLAPLLLRWWCGGGGRGFSFISTSTFTPLL